MISDLTFELGPLFVVFVMCRINYGICFQDNMPVTWCYRLNNNEVFCNRGFPMGCYITGIPQMDDLCTYLIGGVLLHS